MQSAEDYSWTHYDQTVGRVLHHIQPSSVLDVGAGAGKFGRMCRAICPQAILTGLEVGEESVERHGLRDIYDALIEDDAADLITHHPLATWDVAILGDVIEHMRKSDGIDLLNWLTYRASCTIVITPEAMAMHRDPWWEGHNSVWTARDFGWHDNWATHRLAQAQFFLFRGYRPGPIPLADLVERVNADGLAGPFAGMTETIKLKLVADVSIATRSTDNGVETLWWRAL